MARRLTASRQLLVGERTAHRGEDVSELLHDGTPPSALYWLIERAWVEEWDDGEQEVAPPPPEDWTCRFCPRPNSNEHARNVHEGKIHPAEHRALKRAAKAEAA